MKKNISNFIKRQSLNAFNAYKDYRFHEYHHNLAFKALNNVEKHFGKLDIKLKGLADDYAQSVLGSIKYSPWLYVYSALRKDFFPGWIPGNYYGLVLAPFINGKYHPIDIFRTLTNRILHSRSIPDTAYLIQGIFYSSDFLPIKQKEIKDVIFKDSDIVFFKINDTAQGKGIEKIHKNDFDINKFLHSEDGCFQSLIMPHDFFMGITTKSTSTIRVTTVRETSGLVSVRAAYLRVGRDTDNRVTSANAVRIPINLIDGSLEENGFLPSWMVTKQHPDSGFRFSGKNIPLFERIKEMCLSLHQSFPHFSLIGWDTCIDKDDEVKIMEWNAFQADIVFSEATTGPCFQGLDWEVKWRGENKKRWEIIK